MYIDNRRSNAYPNTQIVLTNHEHKCLQGKFKKRLSDKDGLEIRRTGLDFKFEIVSLSNRSGCEMGV